MGTHPNGPAHLFSSPSRPLSSLLSTNPQSYLGQSLLSKFPNTSTHRPQHTDPELPFLFKILSIAKALPLQAHPDKALAEHLNAKDSENKNFVDANHKPEIALALGDFRGFVGFKPLEEIYEHINSTRELKDAITGSSSYPPFGPSGTSSVKYIISSLLKRPQSEITPLVESLVKRTRDSSDPLHKLVQTLNAQYPGDVGVLIAPFLMNLITLRKGEAIYIPADDAHAYLDGDIIECMAVSDNVINAAFVPPEDRDNETFVEMLTYTSRPASQFALKGVQYPKSLTKRTVAYDPPLEEFTVLWTRLGGGTADEKEDMEEVLEAVKGPTVGIVTEGTVEVKVGGEKEMFEKGACFFVKAEEKIGVTAKGEKAEVFWATVVE